MAESRTVASVALMAKDGNPSAEAACRDVEKWLRARSVPVWNCGPMGEGFSGADRMALRASRAVVTTGAETVRLAAGLAAAALLIALLGATWWREGR